MRWTLITDPAGHPGWWHMALDQALLEGAPVLEPRESVVRRQGCQPCVRLDQTLVIGLQLSPRVLELPLVVPALGDVA